MLNVEEEETWRTSVNNILKEETSKKDWLKVKKNKKN